MLIEPLILCERHHSRGINKANDLSYAVYRWLDTVMKEEKKKNPKFEGNADESFFKVKIYIYSLSQRPY